MWELVLVTTSWSCIVLPVFVCGKHEAVQSYRVYYPVPGPIFTPSTCTNVSLAMACGDWHPPITKQPLEMMLA